MEASHFVFCRKREISRLFILPLTNEATPTLGSTLDQLMDSAGKSLGELVQLRGRLTAATKRVQELARNLQTVLPEGETRHRIAQNYAQNLVATELVSCLNSNWFSTSL